MGMVLGAWCALAFHGTNATFVLQTGLFLSFVEMKRGIKRRKLCHTDEETRWRERRYNHLDSREKKKKENRQWEEWRSIKTNKRAEKQTILYINREAPLSIPKNETLKHL